MIAAIEHHGLGTGLRRGFARLARCHPRQGEAPVVDPPVSPCAAGSGSGADAVASATDPSLSAPPRPARALPRLTIGTAIWLAVLLLGSLAWLYFLADMLATGSTTDRTVGIWFSVALAVLVAVAVGGSFALRRGVRGALVLAAIGHALAVGVLAWWGAVALAEGTALDRGPLHDSVAMCASAAVGLGAFAIHLTRFLVALRRAGQERRLPTARRWWTWLAIAALADIGMAWVCKEVDEARGGCFAGLASATAMVVAASILLVAAGPLLYLTLLLQADKVSAKR